MIPQSPQVLVGRQENQVRATKTYRIDFNTKRIIGVADGSEAVVQFIRKVLRTDKYAYEIYDWYYGNEIMKLVGQPYEYIVTRLPNIIREALLVDDRITEVRDFTVRRTQLDAILVSFIVDTVYGQIVYEQEVLT